MCVCVCVCVCAVYTQVAMQRAKVVVRSVIVSGENHLRLVKVKDMQTEIADQEAAYLDNTGTGIVYTFTCVCVFIPGWLADVQSLQLAGAGQLAGCSSLSALIKSVHMWRESC